VTWQWHIAPSRLSKRRACAAASAQSAGFSRQRVTMDDATLMAQLLPALLSHDNDVRRAAEAQLNVRAAKTRLQQL